MIQQHAPDLLEEPLATTEPPLVVDLDGTLVATDTLWESLVLLVKTKPATALAAPLWLFGGRAHFKTMVRGHVEAPVESLPYREDVLAFVRAEHRRGRELVLATAAHQDVADQVARHLGLFSCVIATQPGVNMKGVEKARAIEAHLGERPFDYIGDSRADIPVWRRARKAFVAAPSRSLLNKTGPDICFERTFGKRQGRLRPMVKACRPHQWAKNVLLFVPLMLGFQSWSLSLMALAVLAFLCFGLVASAVYIVNDLLDLAADRAHTKKRSRPFASGALAIPYGVAMAAGLFTLGVGTAALVMPIEFVLALSLYATATFAYSLYVKRLLILDVLCLASLYTIRIIAGGSLPGLIVSEWLLVFSMFFFTSLAFVKRYSELVMSPAETPGPVAGQSISGRNYGPADIDLVRALGLTTGVVAVLVFSLYVSSDYVHQNYKHREVLWLINPILFYWICRIWFLAERRQLPYDPVVFALRDRNSYLAGVVTAFLLALAK